MPAILTSDLRGHLRPWPPSDWNAGRLHVGAVAGFSSETPAGFVGIRTRDVEAVRGAIETPWSTSPVEGQINRLKMLKRAMFGRAGFDLLRQRVLNAA